MFLNRRIRQISFLLLVTFLIPVSSFAWGRDGHQMVAEIAMHYLSPAATKNLLQVLGTTSPAAASVWMDEQRSNSAYDYMKPWHYINIEEGKTYDPASTDNIISALQHAFAELQANNTITADQAKLDALILFHLMGDMHQPLHVGYGADKGGNTVQVQFAGSGTNLHHVWDNDIIESQHITVESCLALGAPITKKDIENSKVVPGDFIKWMDESRALLPKVYDFKGHKLDEAYAQRNKPVVMHQLLYAGIRLAAVLETVFSKQSAYIAGPATPVAATNAPSTVAAILSVDEAINHIGETATVCGKVYGGKFIGRSKVTFINMGAAYPDSPFTVVIFGGDRDKFEHKPESYFDGKNICVTGTIKTYKGKTEIIVSEASQITVK